MDSRQVETSRLWLVACPAQVARAAVRGRRQAEALLGFRIHDDWPSHEIRTFLSVYAHHVERDPDHLGWGIWLIVHRADQMVIGDVGFKGRPNHSGTVDIGYGVVAPYRQQGYAYEAAAGLCGWAFAQPGVRRITGDCLPENTASARILQKMGMRRLSISDAGLLLWEMHQPPGANP